MEESFLQDLVLSVCILAAVQSVRAAIDGTLQGLLIVKADLDREASRFSRRISDAPGQERQYVSIARQQEIKAGLYLWRGKGTFLKCNLDMSLG